MYQYKTTGRREFAAGKTEAMTTDDGRGRQQITNTAYKHQTRRNTRMVFGSSDLAANDSIITLGTKNTDMLLATRFRDETLLLSSSIVIINIVLRAEGL